MDKNQYGNMDDWLLAEKINNVIKKDKLYLFCLELCLNE